MKIKLKKINILIALCTILTICGVYATWIYTNSMVNEHEEPIVIKMSGLEYSESSGLYAFSNNTLDFAIEPSSQDDRITTLVWGNGSMILTFDAPDDITETALDKALRATITVELISDTPGVYDGRNIYTVNPDFYVTLSPDDWTNNYDTTYTYVIDKNVLYGSIAIGQFHLSTKDEYELFNEELQLVKFRVKFTPAE